MDILEFIKLFGERVDSPAMQALLATTPPHRLDKPADGSQYLVSREGGFDLLFEDANAIGGRRQNRTLCCIFRYADGVDRHKAFSGALPFGFDLGDKRADLLAKKAPVRTWVIGEGRVPIEHPNPDSDTWQSEAITVTAIYADNQVRNFQIVPFSVANEEDEWKAPPTWRELAMSPETKAAAIKRFRQEAGVGLADAKKAVDDYISSQRGGGSGAS